MKPIAHYLYQKYPHGRIRLMLGISADEWYRMRDSSYSRIQHVYPLVDGMISRRHCLEIIRDAGLELPQKSSCWFPHSEARGVSKRCSSGTHGFERWRESWKDESTRQGLSAGSPK